MTLPTNDAATPPLSQAAEQVNLDAVLAAAAAGRRTAAIARADAARQLADYVAGELAGVAVTVAETTSQLALYRRAVDAHKAAHARYVEADVAWTRG
jgi:hypothetical protein